MFKLKFTTKDITWDGICLDEEDMQRECKYKKLEDAKYLVEFPNKKRIEFSDEKFNHRFKVRSK